MGQMAILFALGSAALFGLSTPAAKILLGSVHPAMLAGLLYCGAGLGVGALRLLWRRNNRTPDVALVRRDVPWLVAAICSGGIVGPLLLLIGLAQTQAATASLLLAFEGGGHRAHRPAGVQGKLWCATDPRDGIPGCRRRHPGMVRGADAARP